jgi:hypothetical protein
MEPITVLNRRVGAVEVRVETLEGRFNRFTGKEFPDFKSTVFLMVQDLTGALEELSGVSLRFREELKKLKTRH